MFKAMSAAYDKHPDLLLLCEREVGTSCDHNEEHESGRLKRGDFFHPVKLQKLPL
jgi:hypothetical protein